MAFCRCPAPHENTDRDADAHRFFVEKIYPGSWNFNRIRKNPQEPSIQLGRHWCVAGLKTAHSMNRDTLYMEMRKLSDS